MNKTIQIDNKDFILPLINLVYNKEFIDMNMNPLEYNDLIFYKNKIDELNDHKTWDKSKKLSNDYELIYLPNKKMKGKSIALYDPLSRSYFKLWEIIMDFNLANSKTDIRMTGLAEGPGGFIEAFINYRNVLPFLDGEIDFLNSMILRGEGDVKSTFDASPIEIETVMKFQDSKLSKIARFDTKSISRLSTLLSDDGSVHG